LSRIERSVVWICKHFNREQVLRLIDELIILLEDKHSKLKPKDEFKEKHPNYREFSTDPLAPLNATEIVKPKKT